MKKNFFLLAALTASFASYANSPYISKVYEYFPAPGQFINEMPEIESSADYQEVLTLVEEQLCGAKMPGLISLGAWGGYVVFGFDHKVVNVAGEYDFKIYGNAVLSNEDRTGGSCEPGIVMVSIDENGDGLPNDTWYELAGSAYNDAATKHNYSLTYYHPKSDADDAAYIKWTDSEGESGYIAKNTFHRQSYWPLWNNEETMTFTGSRLPKNAVDLQGDGKNFVLMKFDFGYADNLPNNEDYGFNLDWAVDAQGNRVSLSGADFVKVYTAENQICGWIGETSTEIAGAEDLHPDAVLSDVKMAEISTSEIRKTGDKIIARSLTSPLEIFTISGIKIFEETGENQEVDLSNFPQGIYMVRSGEKMLKIAK